MEDVVKALLEGADDDQLLKMLAEIEESKDIDKEIVGSVSDYESCIKINGAPILPPIMDDEKRLDCLKWKRKAMEVEERIGNKRREKLTKNIKNIFNKVQGTLTTAGDNPDLNLDLSELSSDEDSDDSKVYDVLRCNSRAADAVVNNLIINSDIANVEETNLSLSPLTTPASTPRNSLLSSRKDPISYDAKTAPKSFEEVKKLSKRMPSTPRSSRSQPRYLKQRQSSSDFSDDETNATSIKSEVNDDDDSDVLFSFNAAISRNKDLYHHGAYQE